MKSGTIKKEHFLHLQEIVGKAFETPVAGKKTHTEMCAPFAADEEDLDRLVVFVELMLRLMHYVGNAGLLATCDRIEYAMDDDRRRLELDITLALPPVGGPPVGAGHPAVKMVMEVFQAGWVKGVEKTFGPLSDEKRKELAGAVKKASEEASKEIDPAAVVTNRNK